MTEQLFIVVVLVVVGYLLIAMEVFVVPGIGVPGVAGVACLIAACFLAWRFFGSVGGGGLILGVLLLSTLLGALLPRTPFGNWIVHRKNLQAARAEITGIEIGELGFAESDLRPAGIAHFGERRESVVSRGEYIPSGACVELVEVEGSRLVVEEVQLNNDG